MPTFRVKPDQVLPHAGQLFEAGARVELPRHVGQELPHLVEEVDADGRVVPPQDPWDVEAARFRQHERRQVLERHLAAEQHRLEDAAAIAERTGREAADAHAIAQGIRDGIARITAQIADVDRAALAGDPAPAAIKTTEPVTAKVNAPAPKAAEKTVEKAES